MTLEELQSSIKNCVRCSMCKWIPQVQIKSQEFASICPSMDLFKYHSYSGGGKMILANSILTGRLKFTDELLDVIYKCTECGG